MSSGKNVVSSMVLSSFHTVLNDPLVPRLPCEGSVWWLTKRSHQVLAAKAAARAARRCSWGFARIAEHVSKG